MGILGIGIAGAGVLAAAIACETAYFYRRTMIRQNTNMERTMKMAGTDTKKSNAFKKKFPQVRGKLTCGIFSKRALWRRYVIDAKLTLPLSGKHGSH